MFNKFPFHRILGLFTLFSMSLTACNAAPILTAPESTSASDSTPATDFTPTLTPAPTETPTAVPTPTEIPDPTMPLGEVGKDAEGKYVKMENGDIARKVEYKNSAGEILYEGWAVEKTQDGGIPLWDFGNVNLIPFSLFVTYDVPGIHSIESLSHQDNINPEGGGGGSDSLTGVAIADLFHRKNINTKNISTSDQAEMQKFNIEVFNGVATLPLVTSTGESVEGKLGPETGFITIVVPYDSLVPTTENGVTEWLDPYPTSRSSFRSTVLGVDKDGNVIELLASETPLNELPDNLVRALALHLAASVIDKEDQTTQGFPLILQAYVRYADASGDEKVPDIIITRNP